MSEAGQRAFNRLRVFAAEQVPIKSQAYDKACDLPYDPDYAVAPGETLKETLIAMEMTKSELATITGIDKAVIAGILKGSEPITEEIAISLARATGVPDVLWMNLERQYRAQLEKINPNTRKERTA